MALALILLAALAAAQPAEVEPPKLPTRYELPSDEPNTDSVPEKHPWEQIEALVLKRPTTDARLDALESAGDRARLVAYSSGPAAYFESAHRCAALAEKVLAFPESDSAYRRYALYRLFALCATSARDLVPKQPLDRRWERLWLRWDRLLRRLHQDDDAVVAEYFERYKQPDPLPDWRVEKRLAEEGQRKLIAAYPAARNLLEEAWALCEKVARDQDAARVTASPSSRLFGKMKPGELALLDEADASIPSLRQYAVWSNLYPRIVREALGEEGLTDSGLSVKPLWLGWPDYRALVRPKPARKTRP